MNDQLKDDLPGLYRPLGRDHGRQKAQLMALLPEAAPEPTRSPWRRAARLMTGDNTMTMKRRLLKLSPAAAAVAAVVVGVWMLTSPGGLESAYAELTEAVNKTRAAEWVHFKGKHMGKEAEGWISVSPIRQAVKSADRIDYLDGSKLTRSVYTRADGTLRVEPLPPEARAALKKLGQKTFLGVVLAHFDDMKAKEGGKLTRRTEKVGGKTYTLFTVENKNREETMTLRVDTATKRVVTMMGKGGTWKEPMKIDLDYPQTGPADIYALGVPRDTKVVGSKIPKAVRTLDDKVRAAREAFAPSYYAIICTSAQREDRWVPESVRVVYKSDDRFRIEEYGYVPGGIGKDVPVDGMAEMEKWLEGRPVHRVSFIDGLNTSIGTVVRLAPDGKLVRRDNAGVLEKTVELLSWGISVAPEAVRLAPKELGDGQVRFGLERTWQGRVHKGKVRNYPGRERVYYNSFYQQVIDLQELLWDAKAEWQRDKAWLKSVKDPAAVRHRVHCVTKTVQYGRTPGGRRYARKIERSWPGARRSKSRIVVHLDTKRRHIPDTLLDPKSVTPELFKAR